MFRPSNNAKSSFEQPSPEPFYFDHICSPASSHPEESEVLQVAFNSEGMWASSNGAGLDSPTPFGGEQSLDHLLTHKDGLTLKYRKFCREGLANASCHVTTVIKSAQYFPLYKATYPNP
jgi:hypothetical protein